MTDPTPIDRAMAGKLVDWAEQYIRGASTYAATLGTEISLGQIIGTFLTVGEEMTEAPLLYDQYIHIWHTFRAAMKEAEAQAFGTGPEATADAPDAETAQRMAEHWAEKVNDVALGGAGVSQDDWTRWEAQFDA